MPSFTLSVGGDCHPREKLRLLLFILSIEEECRDSIFTIVIMEAHIWRIVPIRDGSLSNIEPKEHVSAFYRLVYLRRGHSAFLAKDERKLTYQPSLIKSAVST